MNTVQSMNWLKVSILAEYKSCYPINIFKLKTNFTNLNAENLTNLYLEFVLFACLFFQNYISCRWHYIRRLALY